MQYNKIFWGFIVILLDFRLGGYDIIPDFVGCIMIYQALSEMELKNDIFGKAKNFAGLMILTSIFDVFQNDMTFNQVNFNTITGMLLILKILTIVLTLCMIYYICRGISDEARRMNYTELESKAMKRWWFCLISQVLVMVGSIAQPLLISAFILYIVAYLMFLVMIRSCVTVG